MSAIFCCVFTIFQRGRKNGENSELHGGHVQSKFIHIIYIDVIYLILLFFMEFPTSEKKHLSIRYDVFLCFCYDTNNFYYISTVNQKKLSVNLRRMKEIFFRVTFIYSFILSLSLCITLNRVVAASHSVSLTKKPSIRETMRYTVALRFRDDVFFDVCVCM